MDLIEAFARRCAKQITRDGKTVLITDHDPLLVDAFKKLGWKDPHEDEQEEEVAVEREAPERAVIPHKSKR
jgi:hypothetical protein